MTTMVYFIRHAQSDRTIFDDRNRPLTPKGKADALIVTDFLNDKAIDVVFSSPYKRSIDTLADFASKFGFSINLVEDFRERAADIGQVNSIGYVEFLKKQWLDFDFALPNGENFNQVQSSNIAALMQILEQNQGKNIAIGSHGMAMGTIIKYFNNSYGIDDFMKMIHKTPYALELEFNNTKFVTLSCIDLTPFEEFSSGYKPQK